MGGKGAFVLLRTSNPGMVDIEQQELKAGGLVLDKTGTELKRIANEFSSIYTAQTCSPIGAVVGWLLGIVGGLIEIYSVIGIVVAVLVFLKIV